MYRTLCSLVGWLSLLGAVVIIASVSTNWKGSGGALAVRIAIYLAGGLILLVLFLSLAHIIERLDALAEHSLPPKEKKSYWNDPDATRKDS